MCRLLSMVFIYIYNSFSHYKGKILCLVTHCVAFIFHHQHANPAEPKENRSLGQIEMLRCCRAAFNARCDLACTGARATRARDRKADRGATNGVGDLSHLSRHLCWCALQKVTEASWQLEETSHAPRRSFTASGLGLAA